MKKERIDVQFQFHEPPHSSLHLFASRMVEVPLCKPGCFEQFFNVWLEMSCSSILQSRDHRFMIWGSIASSDGWPGESSQWSWQLNPHGSASLHRYRSDLVKVAATEAPPDLQFDPTSRIWELRATRSCPRGWGGRFENWMKIGGKDLGLEAPVVGQWMSITFQGVPVWTLGVMSDVSQMSGTSPGKRLYSAMETRTRDHFEATAPSCFFFFFSQRPAGQRCLATAARFCRGGAPIWSQIYNDLTETSQNITKDGKKNHPMNG